MIIIIIEENRRIIEEWKGRKNNMSIISRKDEKKN